MKKGLSCMAFENLPSLSVNTNLIGVLTDNVINIQQQFHPDIPF